MCLLVGEKTRHFYVHEDLICSTSKFFRNTKQNYRKVVEGECSICSEDICETSDLTFCRDCGQNFHRVCMVDWIRTENTCPLCRQNWSHNDGLKTTSHRNLDETGFDMYFQWLYSRRLPLYGEDAPKTPDRFVRLCKAHKVGEAVKDNDFLDAIYTEVIDNMDYLYTLDWFRCVEFAYGNTIETSPLRNFLVDLFVTGATPD